MLLEIKYFRVEKQMTKKVVFLANPFNGIDSTLLVQTGNTIPAEFRHAQTSDIFLPVFPSSALVYCVV